MKELVMVRSATSSDFYIDVREDDRVFDYEYVVDIDGRIERFQHEDKENGVGPIIEVEPRGSKLEFDAVSDKFSFTSR